MRITFTLDIDRESRAQRSDNFFNGILDRVTFVMNEVMTEEVRQAKQAKSQARTTDAFIGLWNSLFNTQKSCWVAKDDKAQAPEVTPHAPDVAPNT